MTSEEAIDVLNNLFRCLVFPRCNGKVSVQHRIDEAVVMAIEALAKMEAIQEVIDMPFEWEQDDRRRYAKIVDIVRKDLTQEGE